MTMTYAETIAKDPDHQALATLLQEVLALEPGWLSHGRATPLLGALPQLDSMAAVAVLSEIESRFGIRIDDEDVGAEMFASFGDLLDFVTARLDNRPSATERTGFA